jgi:hypothetical protein
MDENISFLHFLLGHDTKLNDTHRDSLKCDTQRTVIVMLVVLTMIVVVLSVVAPFF